MQLTCTGHAPGVVFVPTVQDHETLPAPSVRFGSSPFALLGPEAYVTVIVQIAFGAVIALAPAVAPRRTGLVTLNKMSSAARVVSSWIPLAAGEAIVASGVRTDVDVGTLVCAGVAAVVPPAHALTTTVTATRTARPRLTLPSSLVRVA